VTTRSANRVLIANRGEIALRVVRTVRDLGGTSILPYTPEDLLSPAAELADEAHALPEGSSYTDAAAILDLARRTGADAIHPGYGFLSERADFARAVMDADITWVGPSPEAMEALGDKMSARATAERAGVAPVPGITDSVTGPDAVIDFASAHGYPVALKRTDGGGGRGITVLASEEEVRSTPAFEAAAAGGGALILEKFVTAARHIETQCARDGHGAFAVVSTRDCTLQRRNQKLLEEAPAPYLPEGLDARLTGASRRLLEAVDYVGVATCEFLLTPDGDLWFLEVNPRLQVEHCVSEEVTGVDLVEVQLRIAVGGRLGEIPAPRGHSVELRITCEDPARSLAPSTGAITRLRWPAGPGVRIESGVVDDAFNQEELGVRGHGCADRSQNLGGLVITPVVENTLHHVKVTSLGNSLEEVTHFPGKAVRDVRASHDLARLNDRRFRVQDGAMNHWVLRHDSRKEGPFPTPDVDYVLESGKVIHMFQGLESTHEGHALVKALREGVIILEILEERLAEIGSEYWLSCADGFRESFPRTDSERLRHEGDDRR